MNPKTIVWELQELNAELHERTGADWMAVTYRTDGFCEKIVFLGEDLWISEEGFDGRKPFITMIRARMLQSLEKTILGIGGFLLSERAPEQPDGVCRCYEPDGNTGNCADCGFAGEQHLWSNTTTRADVLEWLIRSRNTEGENGVFLGDDGLTIRDRRGNYLEIGCEPEGGWRCGFNPEGGEEPE